MGAFDYTVEIAPKPFNDRFLYTPDPNDDNPSILQAAEEQIRNYSDAIEQLLRWFLVGRRNNGFFFRGPGLMGKVTDAVTARPLAATIEIEGFESPHIQPRTSDPQFGRFYRLLPPGTYNVRVSKAEYEGWTGQVTLNSTLLTVLEITLASDGGSRSFG